MADHSGSVASDTPFAGRERTAEDQAIRQRVGSQPVQTASDDAQEADKAKAAAAAASKASTTSSAPEPKTT